MSKKFWTTILLKFHSKLREEALLMPINPIVKCPICDHRLMDVSEKTLPHTHAMPAKRNEPPWDYQIKCPGCKRLINIIKDSVA